MSGEKKKRGVLTGPDLTGQDRTRTYQQAGWQIVVPSRQNELFEYKHGGVYF